MNAAGPDITQLLIDWSGGDEAAPERLMPLVYEELRRAARRYMRREGSEHTLQTTDLVNEAYLRLVDQSGVSWQNRAHFFALAAQIMRHILVDYARRRRPAPGRGLVGRLTARRGIALATIPDSRRLMYIFESHGARRGHTGGHLPARLCGLDEVSRKGAGMLTRLFTSFALAAFMFGASAAQAQSTTQTVKKETKDAAKEVGDKAEDVVDKTKDGAKAVGEKTKDGAKAVGEKTGDAAVAVGEKTAAGAKAVGSEAADKVEDAGDVAVDAGKEVGDKAEDVGDKAVKVGKGAAKTTKKAGAEAADKAEDAGGKAVDVTKSAGREAGDKIEDGADASVKVGRKVGDKAEDAGDATVKQSKKAGSAVGRGFKKIGRGIKSIFN